MREFWPQPERWAWVPMVEGVTAEQSGCFARCWRCTHRHGPCDHDRQVAFNTLVLSPGGTPDATAGRSRNGLQAFRDSYVRLLA